MASSAPFHISEPSETPPVTQGPSGMPAHPYLQPIRHSRTIDSQSPNETLQNYRDSLLNLLHTNHWDTKDGLRDQRDRLVQQVSQLQLDIQAWVAAWTSCNSELLAYVAERTSLFQQINQLTAEVHRLQCLERDVINERAAAESQQHFRLDMMVAKDRQIQVLKKRLARQQMEPQGIGLGIAGVESRLESTAYTQPYFLEPGFQLQDL